jgi:hypothetical protein
MGLRNVFVTICGIVIAMYIWECFDSAKQQAAQCYDFRDACSTPTSTFGNGYMVCGECSGMDVWGQAFSTYLFMRNVIMLYTTKSKVILATAVLAVYAILYFVRSKLNHRRQEGPVIGIHTLRKLIGTTGALDYAEHATH